MKSLCEKSCKLLQIKQINFERFCNNFVKFLSEGHSNHLFVSVNNIVSKHNQRFLSLRIRKKV